MRINKDGLDRSVACFFIHCMALPSGSGVSEVLKLRFVGLWETFSVKSAMEMHQQSCFLKRIHSLLSCVFRTLSIPYVVICIFKGPCH